MSVRGDPDEAGDLDEADTAVSVLFDGHFTRMLRVAVVLLRDVEAAEDVVQDAFLSLYTNWARVRDKDDALGYLHRSVVNGARSRLRRRAVAERFVFLRGSSSVPVVPSAEESALAGTVPGPVLAALRGLPRRECEAVLFRYYLDLSERQTAEALGLRVGSVKGYASRGLKAVRAALAVSEEVRRG